jgi:hypothetical protein
MADSSFSRLEAPMRRSFPLVTLFALMLTAACGGEGGTSPSGDGPGGGSDPCAVDADPTATLSCDVQPIFTASCALSGCHAGTSPELGLDLSAGATVGSTVDVPSSEAPTLARIRPNLPDSSYLVHKIQGTHLSVGGSGAPMPLGGTLTQAQIDTVRSWVTLGARND